MYDPFEGDGTAPIDIPLDLMQRLEALHHVAGILVHRDDRIIDTSPPNMIEIALENFLARAEKVLEEPD